MQLIGFGPPDFAAYVRLRYIPDPAKPDQMEADVNVADDYPSDIEQARRALDHLGRFTTTPEDCYFCVWGGRSDVHFPPEVRAGPMVTIPDRRYFLIHGSLTDLDRWDEALGGSGYPPPPSFTWPADHSWCLASDVDPHWAGIGASQTAIDSLLNDAGLDVVPAQPADPQPAY